MHTALRYLLVCVLVWLVPFLASVPFYDVDGTLRVPFPAFKGLMVLLLCITTYVAFRRFYRGHRPARAWQALALGAGAVAVSIALDSLTVLPLSGINPQTYIASIGLWYVLIIVFSWFTWRRTAYRKEHVDAAETQVAH